MMKRIVAALAGLFALALPSAAYAQCSGLFTSGYFCGNSTASGGLAGATSPTAMFDRAFGGTNNSTVVRLGGVWTVLASANNGVWITSVAGVPSITSTLPNAVQDNITRLGTIANVGAPIGATFGGTGQSSYAVGDLLYAPTTTTVGKLADVATGNAVLSGGINTAPSYGKIGLTTHVSGQLPLANGGCNGTTAATCLNNIMPTPTRAGDVAYWNGSIWTTLAGNNSGTNVFTENSSGVPSWTAPGTGTVTSVALALPAFITVSGSPVTTTGTLTGTLATQTANTIFAGPTSGGAATPTFRAQVLADLPTTAVTSGGTSVRVEYANVTPTSGAACTVNAQSGSWITSTTPGATGNCTLNFSAIWSAAPVCNITIQTNDVDQADAYTTRVFSASTTTMQWMQQVSVGAAASIASNSSANIVCVGIR